MSVFSLEVDMTKCHVNISSLNGFMEKKSQALQQIMETEAMEGMVEAILEEGISSGEKQTEEDKQIMKLFEDKNFHAWSESCSARCMAFLNPTEFLKAGVKCTAFVNGYQGQYEVEKATEACEDVIAWYRQKAKEAPKMGAEQLLRRVFEVDGKWIFNPFGGTFLNRIQELPLIVKFWIVLGNIVEAVSKTLKGDTVDINYFAQLFPINNDKGTNLFTALLNAVSTLWGTSFTAEAMDLETKLPCRDKARLQAALEGLVEKHEYKFKFDDFGPDHLAFDSTKLSQMKILAVKMGPNMKAVVVQEILQNDESNTHAEWMAKVNQIGDVKVLVLEGSDNCAGHHPGMIFTDETKSNCHLAWKDFLAEFSQEQVENANAKLVHTVFSRCSDKRVFLQGGFGVLTEEVDEDVMTSLVALGQRNVPETFGSTAWSSWNHPEGSLRKHYPGLK